MSQTGMKLLCMDGPWQGHKLYVSDAHATAILNVPHNGNILRGRYVRRGSSPASDDFGVTLYLQGYWQPM